MKKLFLFLCVALISFVSQAQSEESDENGYIDVDSILLLLDDEEEDVALEEDSDDFTKFIYWSMRAEFSELEYRFPTEKEDSLFHNDSLNTIKDLSVIRSGYFRKENLAEALMEIRQEFKIFQSVNFFQFYFIEMTIYENNKYEIGLVVYNLKEPLIFTHNSIDDEW